MISADDVSFDYNGTPVLGDVRLTAALGRVVGLIGPNGSGKTTLLRILYRALTPRAGLVALDERPITELTGAELARRLAVVSQEEIVDVPLTVAEMTLLGRAPHRGAFSRYTGEDRVIAAAALRRVGARHLAERTFTTLSGGEKQRVLIARALTQEPTYLLLDEPTNHLDVRYQHEVLTLIRGLDQTTVVVLHDLNLAARYCHELVLLDGGRVAAVGTADDVLTPEVLEPVYQVGVRRLVERGAVQLLFSPLDPPSG